MQLMRDSIVYRKLFTYERRMLFDVVTQVGEEHIHPKVIDLHLGRASLEDIHPHMLEFRKIGVPSKYGGEDGTANIGDLVILHHGLARNAASAAAFFDGHGLFTSSLLLAGNEEQKQLWLPQATSGKIIGCYGLTDTKSGSNVAEMGSLLFTRKGDSFVLNGSKAFVTNGPDAGVAVVFARESGNDDKYHNITAFIVPAKRLAIDGFVPGEPENKIGWRGSHTSQIHMQDVVVPPENVLGKIGDGFRGAVIGLAYGRLKVGVEALGIMEAIYDELVKWSQTRPGTGVPFLKNSQLFQYDLAGIAQKIQATRDTIYNTVLLAETLESDGRVASFAIEAANAKSFAGRNLQEVAGLGVEYHGGYGFTYDYRVAVYYADSKLYVIGEGADKVVRFSIGAMLAGSK